MNLGNIQIADLWLGTVQAKSAYIGSEQVWGGESPTPPGPSAEPLCFTLESTTFKETISLNKNGSPDPISLEYSTDGNTWYDYTWDGTNGLAISLNNNGDKVYFRAKNENQTINSNSINYYQFIATGWAATVRISGNIQTLLKADGTRTDAPAYCYYMLLANRPDWKSAPELPATTLGQYCYFNMFWICSGLITAPALPAMTLADYCYQNMFYKCTSLTTAPALPATTLASCCYRSMFENCSSLTTAPRLPATTITSGVYNSMFKNCTSLTTAPELPATTLAYSCYSDMFNGCSSLSSVNVSFTAWNYGAQQNWLSGVAASGTFTCPAELPDTRGASNIPEGWTKVDAA